MYSSKVGSFTEIEISIFVDNSTRLFNGTLSNKQRNKQVNKLKKKTVKILFLLGAVWDDGRTRFHLYGAYHDFQRLPQSSYVFCEQKCCRKQETVKKWKIRCELISRRGYEAERAIQNLCDDLNLEIIFLLGTVVSLHLNYEPILVFF